MKRTGLGWAIAFVGLLWGSSLKAQTPQVTLTPDRLTVAGSRCLLPGIGCTQAERNVQLRADSAIAGVSILITDLQSTDGTNVFPEQAIAVSLPEADIQPNVPATIPISFHFRGVASGEFEGSLLLNYSGGERSLPITVRAKDAWLLPLLVVLFGVGVGYGVAVYRAEGATRDEILVQMGRLRSQMSEDPDLASSFRTKIRSYLIDTETAMDNKRWEAARDAVERAQQVWDKWRKGREDWLQQLAYQQALAEQTPSEILPATSAYGQKVYAALQETARTAADCEEPCALRQHLARVEQQMERYFHGKAELDRCMDLLARSHLSPEQEQHWQIEMAQLERQLHALPPEDAAAFDRWHTEAATAVTAFLENLARQQPAQSQPPTAQNPLAIPIQLLPPPPPAAPFSLTQVQSARTRLQWFNWASHAIAIALLAGAGFTKLYAGNPVFGSQGIIDYFALLAWGFSAEVTRDTVTRTVQQWRSPPPKGTPPAT